MLWVVLSDFQLLNKQYIKGTIVMIRADFRQGMESGS